jgi:oxygen-dependent protoporphyrinogen oxidase
VVSVSDGRVAVVGGGIAGLAAALDLASTPGLQVTVLEASSRWGGKILTRPFGGDGLPVEAGPDSFLARVPEGVDLCRRLGLAEELVAPATGRALVWGRGRLRPLPTGLVLGVPTHLGPLARSGIVSPLGVARASLDLVLPPWWGGGAPARGDRAVGRVVRARLGREVHDRLVEPLLGGINAGRTDHLSLAAVAPQLDAAARRSRSLMLGLRAAGGGGSPGAGGAGGSGGGGAGGGARPVFLTHPAGLTRVVERLTEELAGLGATLLSDARVSSLSRDAGGGWSLAHAGGPTAADAVVLAVPSPTAGELLGPVAPHAARLLRDVPYASVALATLSYPPGALRSPLEGSGFLIPATEGRLVTACTWLSSKWAHLSCRDRVLFRVSMGRMGDDRAESLDDQELVAAAHAELVATLGLAGSGPAEWRTDRWPASFPQYEPGHLDRVRTIESALGPGLTLAGAAYRGLGISSCIAQARKAAAAAREHLLHGAALHGGG